MHSIKTLDDITLLKESFDIECKAASGRDGVGVVPDDMWPTYSSFANSNGGTIILGVKENKTGFSLKGIQNPDKVVSDLYNQANNKNKVNVNLLNNNSVNVIQIEGINLVVIEVPRASRRIRPVYLGITPFGGNSYRRLHDGDRQMDDESVRRMIADQGEEGRDARIIRGLGVDELNAKTLKEYRRTFATVNPEHPFNSLSDREFLRKIGGWRLDPESKESGITLAGLLMFGNMESISDELPNYMVDYQERPEAKTERRWVDRLTLDGRWSGNLYDFYRKVYAKLTAELKIPFSIKKGARVESTPVHIALREALVNTIVHGDYMDRASVLIVKRPDMFGFRNPGLMRIPLENALRGGDSDCRNRILHKMFRFVGAGEQAGTGVPKIMHGWKQTHWQPPKLHESRTPFDQTILELRMIDLYPQEVMDELKEMFGDRFTELGHVEREIIALASIEGMVSHDRLKSTLELDPIALSRMLQRLVQENILEASGVRRATVYRIFGTEAVMPEDVFDGCEKRLTKILEKHAMEESSTLKAGSSTLKAGSSTLKDMSSKLIKSDPNLRKMLETRDPLGYLLSQQLDYPCLDDLKFLVPEAIRSLEQIAFKAKNSKRLGRNDMIEVILGICDGRYVRLACIATLVNRRQDRLRKAILSP